MLSLAAQASRNAHCNFESMQVPSTYTRESVLRSGGVESANLTRGLQKDNTDWIPDIFNKRFVQSQKMQHKRPANRNLLPSGSSLLHWVKEYKGACHIGHSSVVVIIVCELYCKPAAST